MSEHIVRIENNSNKLGNNSKEKTKSTEILNEIYSFVNY